MAYKIGSGLSRMPPTGGAAPAAPYGGGGMSNYVRDALATTGGSGNTDARMVGKPLALPRNDPIPSQMGSNTEQRDSSGNLTLSGSGRLQAPDQHLRQIIMKQQSGQKLNDQELARLAQRQQTEEETQRTGGSLAGNPITPRPVGPYQMGVNAGQAQAGYNAGRQAASGLSRVPPGVAGIPATGGKVAAPSGATAANGVLPQTASADPGMTDGDEEDPDEEEGDGDDGSNYDHAGEG